MFFPLDLLLGTDELVISASLLDGSISCSLTELPMFFPLDVLLHTVELLVSESLFDDSIGCSKWDSTFSASELADSND